MLGWEFGLFVFNVCSFLMFVFLILLIEFVIVFKGIVVLGFGLGSFFVSFYVVFVFFWGCY